MEVCTGGVDEDCDAAVDCADLVDCECNVACDNTPPAALCQDVTVQLAAGGNASIAPANVDNGSSDACGVPSLSLDRSAFTCADVGPNTVTLTVTDVNGNSSTCSATVTVEDNVDAVALCQDVTVQLAADGNASIVEADVDNGSNDACGISTLSLDNTTFDCEDVGSNTVTLTVTDVNVNSSTCDATITVEDNEPPSIICPANETLECPADTSVAANGSATATDNCGVASILQSDVTTPACGDTETIVRTWTATDANGNTVSCDQTLTVVDTTPPPITQCPVATTVECDGAGNVAALNAWLNSFAASDACSGVVLSNDFAGLSDDCGATGSATVTFTATDDCGLQTSCESTFTIEDTIAPAVSCEVDVSTLWPPKHNLVNVGLSVTTSDVCDANPVVSVEVFADEDDEEATGDGNHSPDAKNVAPGTLRLRAERKEDADGRVYLIVVKSKDECGNVGHTCCTVTVTHDMSKASKNSVAAQAALAQAECLLTGAPPAGFVKVGDGPIIGPKQ